MRLFELSNPNPLLVRLVAVTSQLTSEIDSGDQHSDWTVDELLQYYKDNDIILAKDDLYNMINIIVDVMNYKIGNRIKYL